MNETEKIFSNEENDDEINKRIPSSLLSNLITWMRNKGISEKDITDCIQYISRD